MSLQLYHSNLSAPARVIRILIKLLGLTVEEKELNLMTGEHLKPEFTSINPFHVVPTLVDGDFVLWESRAILTYLVNKYAPGNSLYPNDLKARATVDRWLYWDASSLYSALAAYYGPVIRGNAPYTEASELVKGKAKDLNTSLEKTKYVAGASLTLADLSIAVSITLAPAVGIDLNGLKNIDRWLKQLESDLKSSTWSSLVIEPANSLGGFIKSKIP